MTLGKLEALARVHDMSLLDILSQDEISYSLPAKAQSAVQDMVQVIRICRQEKENLRVSDIYDQLLVKSGYLKALETEDTPEAESRIENLLDFKSFIYDYEKEKADAGEKATLEEFLEKVATDGDADKMEEGAGKVTLMTMHSAKGLEFPIVFLPGLEDGLFPGHRALDNESGMEEERRLCYVGMTRAREKLILTGAAYRVLYGRGEYTRESTFLRELDKSLLDEAGDTVFTVGRRTNNHLGVDTGSPDGFSQPAFRPYPAYDPLKYAKQAVREHTRGAGRNFAVGDQVRHGKFGPGLVLEVDDKTVTVMFDSVGRKKLAKDVAPIQKIGQTCT